MASPKTLAQLMVASGAVVLVDQLTKSIVRIGLTVCPELPLVSCDRVAIVGPLGILRTDNGASAFGLSGSGTLVPLLVMALILLGAQALMVRRNPLFTVGLGLQLGGLAANLVDRLLFGAVTDFIHIQVGEHHGGPVANPADIALVVGGMIAAIALFRVAGYGGSGPSLALSAADSPGWHQLPDRGVQ